MTKFESLTTAQQKVFEQVAVGNDAGHNFRVLETLARKGYLERRLENIGGHPPVTISRYSVPIDIHMRWCAFCASLPESEMEQTQ